MEDENDENDDNDDIDDDDGKLSGDSDKEEDEKKLEEKISIEENQ